MPVMAFVRSERKYNQVRMQGGNIRNTVGTGKGGTKSTIDTHISIRDSTKSFCQQRSGSTGQDTPTDMAVTDMYDTDGICRKAGMQQAQLFPKRIEDTKAIRQLIFTKLLKAGRKSYSRNSNSIRTLGIGAERIAICCDFAD